MIYTLKARKTATIQRYKQVNYEAEGDSVTCKALNDHSFSFKELLNNLEPTKIILGKSISSLIPFS